MAKAFSFQSPPPRVWKTTVWKTLDGSLHEQKADAMRHNAGDSRPHRCPACKGTGDVNGAAIVESRRDEDAEAWQGNFPSPIYRDVITGHQQVMCKVCGGWGWTANKMQPLTEFCERIVGYEAAIN